MTSPILQAATRLLSALLIVFSLFLLVRGHDAPGGGFIGGLVAASSFTLLAMSHGVDTARRALRLPPVTVAALGVGAALLAGLIPLLVGDAPFAAVWLFVGGPKGEGVPLSTVLLFDFGVWLVVLGAVLGLVFALEEDA
jgi:multicomponent Na+:H+ antiporter subunit B